MSETLEKQPTKNNPKAPLRRYLCPNCGKHTVLWLRPDTEVKNLPIKCKLCGKESVVNIDPSV